MSRFCFSSEMTYLKRLNTPEAQVGVDVFSSFVHTKIDIFAEQTLSFTFWPVVHMQKPF